MGELLGNITVGQVVVGVIVLSLTSIVAEILRRPKYPALPRKGKPGTGVLSSLYNSFAYLGSRKRWVLEGYEEFTKKGKPFIVPNSLGHLPEVVVPRDQTAWVLDHPDHVVSIDAAIASSLFVSNNFLSPKLAEDTLHVRAVHRNLARHLAGLIEPVQVEVEDAVTRELGTDSQGWKEVNLWEMWLEIVSQVTNRILIGPELCRNHDFTHLMIGFAEAVIKNNLMLTLIPKPMQPFLAPLLCFGNWRLWKKSTKFTFPIIEQRLKDMAAAEAGDPAYAGWTPPEDFVTWTIRTAKAENRTDELNPSMISKRMLPLEFASIHTTVLTGHGVLLDIFSSPPEKQVVEGLTEEVLRVFREEGGQWTKMGLSRLYRVDSAIRESMRVTNMADTLVERKVVAPGGITNEKTGLHLPQGTFVTLNMGGLHHDPEIYENPDVYDAFRFSRERESYATGVEEGQRKKDVDEGLRLKNLGMVTTSDAHLAFGHGRHACPGRFFVAHELKMIIAYILMNYEVKHIAERPKGSAVGQSLVPPLKATISFRRREVPLYP